MDGRVQFNKDTLVCVPSPIWLLQKEKSGLRYLPPANEVWGKVIFSEACVKNSVHRGGVPGYPETRYTPRPGTPPGTRYTPQPGTPPGPGTPTPLGPGTHIPREQCMLGDTGNKRVVRILLECILVVLENPLQWFLTLIASFICLSIPEHQAPITCRPNRVHPFSSESREMVLTLLLLLSNEDFWSLIYFGTVRFLRNRRERWTPVWTKLYPERVGRNFGCKG